MLHDDPARDMGQHAGLAATAYIAWAVFGGGGDRPIAGHASVPAVPSAGGDRRRLRPGAGGQRPSGVGSERHGRRALSRPAGSPETVLGGRKDRLVGRACGPNHVLRRRPLAAASKPPRWRPWRCCHAGYHPTTARSALKWLVGKRDGSGTWYSTQATVLALKGVAGGSGKPLADGRPQHVEIRCDGNAVRDLTVPAEQADVVQQIDLSSLVAAGKHRLTVVDRSGTAALYQVTFRYHLPGTGGPARHEGPVDRSGL